MNRLAVVYLSMAAVLTAGGLVGCDRGAHDAPEQHQPVAPGTGRPICARRRPQTTQARIANHVTQFFQQDEIMARCLMAAELVQNVKHVDRADATGHATAAPTCLCQAPWLGTTSAPISITSAIAPNCFRRKWYSGVHALKDVSLTCALTRPWPTRPWSVAGGSACWQPSRPRSNRRRR